MKRLKAGAVNSISFIRNISYTTNSFDVEFEKVVGTTALTLSGIEDQLGLADCSDFIVLNIDLLSNELDGGEYYMTITNGSNSSTYLCEVQGHKYVTHGTSIYADSVVLSTDLTGTTVENDEAVEDPEGGTTDGDSGSGSGGPSTVSFDVDIWDPNYGVLTPPYQIRTDTWNVSCNVSNVHSSITKVKTVVEDSSGNVISGVNTLSGAGPNYNLYFDIENETINFGDVATVHFEGLDNTDTVLYTSSSSTIYIPPKVELYLAESLAAANAMRGNAPVEIEHIEPNNTTYNLYAYVVDNHANVTVNIASRVQNVRGGSFYPVVGVTIPTFNVAEGVMTELITDAVPDPSTSQKAEKTYYYTHNEWSDGTTTPLINNIAGVYNTYYSANANPVTKYPYAEQTLTVDGFTFTVQGYSPIIHNSSSIVNNILQVKIGDNNYNIDVLNLMRQVRIQQEFTDGTILEESLTPSQMQGNSAHYATSQSTTLIFAANQGENYDYRIYLPSLDTSKTLRYTRFWIKINETPDKWYHIDNGSPESPQYRFDH